MADPAPPPAGRTDRLAARLLAGPLTAAALLAGAAALAAWLPHYLGWPFWSDHDGFAMMARAWDLGERPYRDVASNQFPGPIYASWALGRLFGWGRTGPTFAADAALLLGLVAALLAWSRRRLGGALPGAVGGLAILSYYLNLDYTLVLQRDWHAAALAVLGLLALQAWPGRASRLGAALAVTLAFCVRPHVVLFLPAVALAIDEGTREPGGSLRPTLRALAGWAVAWTILTTLAFAPLALEGLGDDFLGGLRHATYNSSYSKHSLPIVLLVIALQLTRPLQLLLPALLGTELVRRRARPDLLRMARTWFAAGLFVFFYKPLNPVPLHGYLDHPLALVATVQLAMLAAIVLQAGERGLSSTARLVLVGLAVAAAMPGPPRFCDVAASLRSIRSALRGESPPTAPPGYVVHPGILPAAYYPWDDYRATMAHLRAGGGPRPRVANLLYGTPALLGSTGRLPALPYDAGIVWLHLVERRAQGDFARALEQADDSVVVWIPDEPPPRSTWDLSPLRSLVPRLYEPEARFGSIEVWRRRPRQTGPGQGYNSP